ncbi:MAG: hypothetical protein A2571_00325 [Candidatus Vogelbacteria bacterium RIFOXYD1_FULL_44_32]|uniref:Uncharacterized protein n=1 Tax=Candidatus Vogelbacteria bacterium RIFOXYD1_FULL_44_32 TaxID=1802438 RepID=A0A1G2QEG7_9BACT|nr:MAG: hypothetical protein A2571_00325 [Candidatus Vogelbacteria bacterium RIFOXYD1_FULL_44_32]
MNWNIKKFREEIVTKNVVALVLGILLGFVLYDASTISINELKTPSLNFVKDDQSVELTNRLGLASFDGAWVAVSGGEMTNDVNSVAIDCWLEEKICNIAQADVIFDDQFTNGMSYYDITEWTKSGQITAISSSLCEDQILKADIKTMVVTLTEARKDDADSEMCVQGSTPMVLKLSSRGYGIQ